MSEPENIITDEEALSILGRLEAERRAWEQQTLALRFIGELIRKAAAASKILGPLVAEKESLTNEISQLDSQLKSQRRKGEEEIRVANTSLANELSAQVEPLQVEIASLLSRKEQALSDCSEAEQSCQERVRVANEAATEAERRLASIQTELVELRAKLG